MASPSRIKHDRINCVKPKINKTDGSKIDDTADKSELMFIHSLIPTTHLSIIEKTDATECCRSVAQVVTSFNHPSPQKNKNQCNMTDMTWVGHTQNRWLWSRQLSSGREWPAFWKWTPLTLPEEELFCIYMVCGFTGRTGAWFSAPCRDHPAVPSWKLQKLWKTLDWLQPWQANALGDEGGPLVCYWCGSLKYSMDRSLKMSFTWVLTESTCSALNRCQDLGL